MAEQSTNKIRVLGRMPIQHYSDAHLPDYYRKCLREADNQTDRKFFAAAIQKMLGITIPGLERTGSDKQLDRVQRYITRFLSSHPDQGFTYKQLHRELVRTGHTYSRSTIQKNLSVLHRKGYLEMISKPTNHLSLYRWKKEK